MPSNFLPHKFWLSSKNKIILLFSARIKEDANWAPAEPAPKIAILLIFLDLYAFVLVNIIHTIIGLRGYYRNKKEGIGDSI